MTAAEDILKLIESVDSDNDELLDEIDVKVAVYYYNADKRWEWYPPLAENQGYSTEGKIKVVYAKDRYKEVLKYTRSRDDLKSIRPSNWHWEIQTSDNFRCFVDAKKYGPKLSAPIKKITGEANTEELAELHAILQAIEYERSDK